MTMPHGTCRLCNQPAELQLSHIVPAFVYRWLRESSGNGHLRSTQAPNLRVQDGPQEYWLCGTCEGRFNRVETDFANKLFHPYLVASGNKFPYGDWLLKFCTSLSWRVLLYHQSKIRKEEFDPAITESMNNAEASWREYLLDRAPHPGQFRQHLLPLDQLESSSGNFPANINRYIMRAIHIDLCQGKETMFVYSKLGRFMILGFINQSNPSQWSGSRVNANQGVVQPGTYVLPSGFRDYLFEKANSSAAALAAVSDRQQDKIDKTFRANIDRYIGSDAFRAMEADVEMFGSSAFRPRGKVEDDER